MENGYGLSNNGVHYSLLPVHPISASFLKTYFRKQALNQIKDMGSRKQQLQPKSSVKGRSRWQLCTTLEDKYLSRLQEDRELREEGLWG